MTNYGINLASETHGPDELAEYARRAEAAGFDFAVVSDHYHPWTPTQGHSPFVWGTLGAIARETETIEVGTAVTCPTIRIHPAVVAQAAATAAVQFDGRFFLGVGTGERLNEHVLGDRWPPHHVRLEMLAEAVGVMRDLWDGGMTSHDGEHYTVENAQVFTLPDEPPPVPVSGLGPETATAAGRFGDGFVCTFPGGDLLDRYEEAGGDGPRYGGMRVAWAESEAAGHRATHEWWPTTALRGVGQELPTPRHFEQAAANVSVEDVAGEVVAGPDPGPYVEKAREFVDAGFDHVYLQHSSPDLGGFVDFFEDELADELPS